MKTHFTRKLLSLVLVLALAISCFACAPTPEAGAPKNDIVILFTNDIHASIENGVTLTGVAWYKQQVAARTPNVVLVDCGDAVSGSFLGTVSKGDVVIDAMNAVGYDYCALGNHEFDFGLETLSAIIEKNNATYLGCNVSYSGTGADPFAAVKPYVIHDFDGVKVAFVGISTPETLTAATPAYLQENGEYVVSFAEGDDGKALCAAVQNAVDAARAEGADYVIALGHLGVGEEYPQYSSTAVIAATNGIDAFLDGHSHSTFTLYNTENKDGKAVPCAQTGTALENLGQLVITTSGFIAISNISDIDKEDEAARVAINGILAEYNELLTEVIVHTGLGLSIRNEQGGRLVRASESAIGNLCADSLRYVTGADIAYVNGGGIRADLPAGDITFTDMMNVMSFGNQLVKIEITGAELADILEYFVVDMLAEPFDESGQPRVENGSFPNVSGLRFTVDTSIPTSILVDDAGMLVAVEGARRVSDIEILAGDTYEPLDPEKVYTFGLADYVARNGGSGMQHYLSDNTVIWDDIMTDYEALIHYITDGLNGDLSGYAEVEGRITVK